MRRTLVVLWFSFCIYVLFLPLTNHPGSYLPDDGDALQGASVLGWVAHQSTTAPLRIFDMNVYYPHPNGLVYAEHLIPQGVFAAVLMRLGCGLILAYNIVWMSAILLTAMAVWLWARELGADEVAAIVAAAVVALTTSTLSEASRLQLVSIQWMPFSLFFFHRFFVTGRGRFAVAFALCFILQGLSCQYYLVSFPLFLVPIALGYWYLFPERRQLGAIIWLGAPLLVGALLLLPIELPYLSVFERYGFDRPLRQGTDLSIYVVHPKNSVLYSWLLGHEASPVQSGKRTFVGYVTLALVAIGLVSVWRSRSLDSKYRWLCLWLAAWGFVFVILSAGSEVNFFGRRLGPGPFRLLYDYVPGFNHVRIPGRLSVYSLFGISLLAGAGASSLYHRLSARLRHQAGLLAALLVVIPLEHARRQPLHIRVPTHAEIPEVYRWLAGLPGDFAVAELPTYPRRFIRFYGYQTYFSTTHWKRILFGKPSFMPPVLEYMMWTLGEFPSREATRLLQSLNIRFVVYHPHQGSEPRRVIRRLRKDPNFGFVRRFPDASPTARRLGYGNEVVFEVLPESMPSPHPDDDERAVPSGSWSFVTSSDVDATLAVDGDLATAWSSASSQKKGQFFDIQFGRRHVVTRISLRFSHPYGTFPRAALVNGYTGNRGKRLRFGRDPWQNARVVERLVADPSTAAMDWVLLEPTPLERIRIFINETEPNDVLPEWRIPEIQVFETIPDAEP